MIVTNTKLEVEDVNFISLKGRAYFITEKNKWSAKYLNKQQNLCTSNYFKLI